MKTIEEYVGPRWLTVVLTLAALSFGCATVPLRLKADDELFEVQPRAVSRVELSDAAYRAVMSSLYTRWELPVPSMRGPRQVQLATWGFDTVVRRLAVPQVNLEDLQSPDSDEATGNRADLLRGYFQFCEHRGERADCLDLLLNGPSLTSTDRRTVATRIALAEAIDAAKDMLHGVTAHQVEVAVLSWMVVYMGLLAMPEPVSKVVIIALAAHLIASIGVDLFLSFVQGYRQLKRDAEAAETFADVREAGERYGRLIGPSGARLMVLLVSLGGGGALGSVAGGSFPGAAQSAANADALGFALSGASAFTFVQVATAGTSVTFGVGAGMAVAPWVLKEKGEDVTDKRPRGFRSYSSFKRARGSAGPGKEWHHIVEQTDKNVARFGAERVHHDDNMVKLDVEAHRKISGYYSSRQRLGKGETIRSWLNTQSFEAQREFGLRIMRRFGVTP